MFSLTIIAAKISLILFTAGFAFSLTVARKDRRWVQQILVPIFPLAFAAGTLLPGIAAVSALIIVLPMVVARTKGDAAALFPVLLVSLPALGFPIRLGGVGIGNYDTWLVATFGTALAVMVKPGEYVKGTPILASIVLFVILTIFVNSRNEIATVYLRLYMRRACFVYDSIFYCSKGSIPAGACTSLSSCARIWSGRVVRPCHI